MTAQALDFKRLARNSAQDLRTWRTRARRHRRSGARAADRAGSSSIADQFYRSYLWSYVFSSACASGALAWLMLQYLTGGAWGVVIRRPCEAAARTLPLLALLFLPIVIGIPICIAGRTPTWWRPMPSCSISIPI